MTLAIDIIATAQAMNSRGINAGTAGNVSARTPTGMLITPSGMDYDELTPDDIVAMDFDATWFATSDLRPSSEWRMHLDILSARPDVHAIVHTHSTHATALSAHRRGIEPFHYMVSLLGGTDVRCAPYALFGSQELSDHTVRALEGRTACLLSNHGVVAVGTDLTSALSNACLVEELARQYLVALALGEPALLTMAEMDQVQAKMDAIGYQRRPARSELDDETGATVLHLER